jgi:hypothetical protein
MVGEAVPVRAYGIDLVECVVAYQAGFAQNLVDGALPDGSSIRSSVLTGPRHTAPSRRAVAAGRHPAEDLGLQVRDGPTRNARRGKSPRSPRSASRTRRRA